MSQQPNDLNPEEEDADVQASASAVQSAEEELEQQTELVRDLSEAVRAGDGERVSELVEPVHSADLADVFELLPHGDRKELVHILGDQLDPDILPELEGQAFEDVISEMESSDIAGALSQMDSDDAAYVLEEMDETAQLEVLEQVSDQDRIAIEELLSYPEDTAGRMMERKLIAVAPFWNVGQVLDYLRSEDEIADDFWEIFVVDPQYHPIGTMALSKIMRRPRETLVGDIMQTEQTLIPVEMDQEEVADRFRRYNLVSAAVVDNAGRLVGVVKIDDIVDVIDEEAEEDILALAGVSEGDVNISVREITKTRFGWLLVNLLTAILASAVIAQFGASIEELVALAILMPIVASMGGNAGTQTMTVAVRALATRELTSANAARIVTKELFVSLANGALLAVLMGVVAAFWFASAGLGLVIGAAMVLNMIVAGLSGIMVPLVLDRMNIDPAVSSTVFVTTITDVVGFLAFLGLAATFLM